MRPGPGFVALSHRWVEDEPSASTAEPSDTTRSTEQDIKGLQSSGVTKIFFGADLMVGILLGKLVRVRADRDYVAWKEVMLLKGEQAQLDAAHNSLAALIEIAKKKCMAGILRAMHEPRRKRPTPYHHVLQLLLLALIFNAPRPAAAQQVTRQEGI